MWLSNLEEAKRESLKTQKPILLQFEMDGCGGCKKLYQETYADPQVHNELAELFVLLKLDLIKDRDIRRELAAYWTPSFYFLDRNGKTYHKFNGFLPPREFRILLRIGYAETQIPKGKYAEALRVMNTGAEQFVGSPLLPTLSALCATTDYIRSKDKAAFMSEMKIIRQTFPNSLEATMYFWNS